MPQLTDAARTLLQEAVLAHVATVGPDGRPHVTPVWVDVDGDDIVLNTPSGSQKARNLERNPAVAISVTDPKDYYRVVVVKGVAAVSEEGADEHIDKLAQKYLGQPTYPWRDPARPRLKVRVTPDRVLRQPEDA